MYYCKISTCHYTPGQLFIPEHPFTCTSAPTFLTHHWPVSLCRRHEAVEGGIWQCHVQIQVWLVKEQGKELGLLHDDSHQSDPRHASSSTSGLLRGSALRPSEGLTSSCGPQRSLSRPQTELLCSEKHGELIANTEKVTICVRTLQQYLWNDHYCSDMGFS
jgi:hypothetical protein